MKEMIVLKQIIRPRILSFYASNFLGLNECPAFSIAGIPKHNKSLIFLSFFYFVFPHKFAFKVF